MSFGKVNLPIAKPEELFQRQAYINAVVKHAVVYNAIGNAHQLSKLIQLSRGKIPSSLQFSRIRDYEQNAILRSMKVQDFCCTYSDWIQRGGTPNSMINVTVKDNGSTSAWEVHCSELIYQRL